MHKTFLAVLCLGATTILSGCGGDGKVVVSGTIRFDGELIPDDHTGYVVLTPVDTSVAPDSGKIGPGGSFRFRATPGEKRVEIFIDRPKGKTVDVMGAPEREPYIPKRYNEATELSATLTTSGPNEFDFALETRPGDEIAGID